MLRQNKLAKQVVVGAGPAAILDIVWMLRNGIPAAEIVWVDPEFNVGDFGGELSSGSSVPGNTKADNYRKIYKEIYAALPFLAPEPGEVFALDKCSADEACLLDIAAEPLRHITHKLRKKIPSIQGKVVSILNDDSGSFLKIQCQDGSHNTLLAENVTLAVGGVPRTYDLPQEYQHLISIDPNIAFNEAKLTQYLKDHPEVKKVAVIGSSHSAALATINFLRNDVSVEQLMNKLYQYFEEMKLADGTVRKLHDDDGLKGNVARDIKKLDAEIAAGTSQFQGKYAKHMGETAEKYAANLKHLSDCTHVVSCIGYKVRPSLTINGIPLDQFKQDHESMQLKGLVNVRGIGLAFPGKPTGGQTKPPVGITKFHETSRRSAPKARKDCDARFFKPAPLQLSKRVEEKALHVARL